MSKVGTVERMGQNLDVLLLWESFSDLCCVNTGAVVKEKGLPGANDLVLLT